MYRVESYTMWIRDVFIIAGAYVISIVVLRPPLKTIVFTLLGLVILFALYIIVTSGADVSGREMFKAHGLVELYDSLNGYVSDVSKHDKKQMTYGEVTGQGIVNVAKIAKEHGIDTFVDMGCGVGRSLILAKLAGFQKCIGIELVEDRYKQAVSCLLKVPSEISKDVEVHHGDMLELDLSGNPKLVFASNLLWGPELNERFFAKVKEQCPKKTLIAASVYKKEDAAGLQKVTSINVPMSWEMHSTMHIFRVI